MSISNSESPNMINLKVVRNELDQTPPRTWKQVFGHEVRTHRFGYGVLAVALVAGPVLIHMIFPEVTAFQAVVGGLAFGVYLAICAVPQKFM